MSNPLESMKSYLNPRCERWLHRMEFNGEIYGVSYWKCIKCGLERQQHEDLGSGA